MPRVTFVIPCYNHGRFVAEAVRSCLAQRGAEVRVVVVNDGSSDEASGPLCDASAALGPGVTVLHQNNRGLPAARNAGAAVVSREGWAEYLAFLDADDWVEPEFCARLHQALGEDGAADVSHAYCQERLAERGTGIWRVPEWDPVLLLVTNLHPVTALVKRERFEAVGGFDETMTRGYEDWDLWLRMAGRGWRGVRVREPLFIWRRHSETTMVIEAVARHGELFSMLMARHAGLYAARQREVIERSNMLLRRADANWLDESGEAICIRDLRAWAHDLVGERDDARRMIEALRVELEAQRAAAAGLEQRCAALENKPSVRLSHRVFAMIDALPRPVAEPFRAFARWARRVL